MATERITVMTDDNRLNQFIVGGLDERQRKQIENMMTITWGYVPNKCFKRKKAYYEIFDYEIEATEVIQAWHQLQVQGSLPTESYHEAKQQDNFTLTRQQEKKIFLQYNYCRYRVYRLLEFSTRKRLSVQRQQQLLWWNNKSNEIEEKIVAFNLGLLRSMASRCKVYQQYDTSYLLQEGTDALLRAVKGFDVSFGLKFSTYACSAIKKGFYRGIDKLKKRNQYVVEYNDAYEINDDRQYNPNMISNLYVQELKDLMYGSFQILTEIETIVIEERFFNEKTLQQSAQSLSQNGKIDHEVSKERIRQIQKQALGKLKEAMLEDDSEEEEELSYSEHRALEVA